MPKVDDLRLVSSAEVTQRTVCTSLIGDWLEETYVVISCWLRCEK